ncbi:cytochrome P450 [Geopyxis carbonaria]|nr:cytochrome P450 [Geopyxis carbonaria]
MGLIATFTTHPLSWQLEELALAAACSGLLYLLGLSLYNLYLHPLSRHPGPLLARMTPLYSLYHAYSEHSHLHITRLHEQYGPVLRFAPNLLILRSPAAIKPIYGVSRPVRKGRFYAHFEAIGAQSVFSASDKADHARKRRTLAPVFTEPAIRGMQELYLPLIQQAILEPSGHGKSPAEGGWSVDMGQLATWLTFDTMFRLSFGSSAHMLDGAQQDIPRIIDAITFRSLLAGTWAPLWRKKLEYVLLPQLSRDFVQFLRYSAGAAEARMARPKEEGATHDFFQALIDARGVDGQPYSHPEMWAEARSLIVAGSDTTATQLAANFHYLCAHPSAQRRLAAEVRAAWSSAEEIRLGHEMDACLFLHAVVDETMRMSPSVPGYFPREVDAPEGMHVDMGPAADSIWVPCGAEVAVPFYALQHDGKYFERADEWVPERWLSAGEDRRVELVEGGTVAAGDRNAWWPFSYGSRGCMGKRLAYAQLYLALAMAAWRWEMEFEDGVEARGVGFVKQGGKGKRGKQGGEYQLIDHLTAGRVGPVVRFRERV